MRKSQASDSKRYIAGTYNAICDQCGRKRKAQDMALQWNNLFVCQTPCFEERNAQEFVRGVPDPQTVPIPRLQTQTFEPDPLNMHTLDNGN